MDVQDEIVFTDLDGTLLDHATYSWEEARPGLALLRQHDIGLIPCTSKTADELVALAERIGFGPSGIVENGSAIAWTLTDPPDLEILGTTYADLRRALAAIRSELKLPLTGFGDMSAADIARHARLDRATAVLSKQRCGDEPFWPERELSPEEIEGLEQAVARHGLRLARGGRYLHLIGDGDKGTAARRIIEQLAADGPSPRSAAFGDAANDQPLLAVVDHPYAVRRPDGSADPVLAGLPGVRVTDAIGPAGFSQGVEDLIRRWRGGPVDPPAASF